MKKIISIITIVFLLFIITSCSWEKNEYPIEDYILSTEYKSNFRILQLTDTHIANKDNQDLQYDFLTLTINDANADLIIVTGDLFTFADKDTAKNYFKFLDSFNIPWTVTFGNHDEQCYFSIDWLTDYLNNYGSNCLFKDIQDDNVYGNANFVINLTDSTSAKAQIIIMDSNRYTYKEYWGYDYIKEDQIAWYEKVVNYTTERNGGEVVPSLLFFHIPLPEYDDAYNAVSTGEAVLEYGEKREPSCPPEYNSGLFDKVLELGSTKGIFVGHDHKNNFRILYKGVYLTYGVNSSDRIYYEEGVMGGQVIIVKSDNTLDFEHIYHSYSEVEEE